MKAKENFLSNIIGYVIPRGSHHDPIGKEGLAMVVSDTYKYGMAGYKNITDFFFKLEKTGATFTTYTGYENTYLLLSVPSENQKEARSLLDEMINNVLTKDVEFEKIKKRRLSVIDDVNSDDRMRAHHHFQSMVLKERKKLGEKDSIENIELKDVKDLQLIYGKNNFLFSKSEPGSMTLEQDFKVQSSDKKEYEVSDERYMLLDREIEQKVIYMGFETEGLLQVDREISSVADAVMYSGLSGLVPEVIRMQNSAAYYAYYQHLLISNKGVALMSAGVSEKNVPKVVQLMYDLFHRGADGDFSDTRLAEAKKYYLGILDRTYDSIESLAYRDLSRELNGLPVYSYEDEVDRVNKVTKVQVQEYFRKYLETGSPYLVVNGSLSSSVKNKLVKQFEKYD